jgi:hypothetical protein
MERTTDGSRMVTDVGARWAGACLALSVAACGADMSVGSNDDVPCPRDGGCNAQVPVSVEIPGVDAGLAAAADDALTPTWSKDLAADAIVAAAEGGLWLAAASADGIALTRVSAEGEVEASTVLASPRPFPHTQARAEIYAMTEHAEGPVLLVRWRYVPLEGFDCSGKPSANWSPLNTCAADGLQFEALVVEGADLGQVRRFDACASGPSFCSPPTLLRSGDGKRVLVPDAKEVRELGLDGALEARIALPHDMISFSGVAVGDTGYQLYGVAGAGPWEGENILLSIARGLSPDMAWLDGADYAKGGTPDGVILPGPTVDETILVLDRYAATLAPETGYGLSDRQKDQPGDLGVVRLTEGAFASQQNLLRQDYSTLRLAGAAADRAGNVYVATSTGDRAAVERGELTPLLCRLPAAGEGACRALPALPEQLVAGADGAVFVRSQNALARYDFE